MLRVGVIGPESTGKSTVCRELSERYGWCWVREYAREYVEALNRPYTYDDVLLIAHRQIDEVRNPFGTPSPITDKSSQSASPSDIVLYDTELIITKVWMEHVFGRVAPEVKQAIEQQPMDMYLILAPDIAAEPDPVRENLDKREYFFQWYIREVEQTGRPYAIIRGEGEIRTERCAEKIKSARRPLREESTAIRE